MATIMPAPIRITIVVNASQDKAFQGFFLRMNDWSPKEHSLSGSRRATLEVEPRTGGRWIETGENGVQCTWGQVVDWEPPRRALLLWQIGSDFSYNPDIRSEIEVKFEEIAPGQTRVDFEHRSIEQLGLNADEARAALAGDDGWGGSLAAYQKMFKEI